MAGSRTEAPGLGRRARDERQKEADIHPSILRGWPGIEWEKDRFFKSIVENNITNRDLVLVAKDLLENINSGKNYLKLKLVLIVLDLRLRGEIPSC